MKSFSHSSLLVFFMAIGGVITNSTTSFESTITLSSQDNTQTVESTTPVKITMFSSTVDSITPTKITNFSTTLNSTTTAQTTNFSTTVDSTISVQTTNISTTTDSTIPIQTTNISTTVYSKIPIQTTNFSTTTDSTIPVQTTNFSTTVNSTTPVQTTDFSTIVNSTTPVQATNLSTILNSTIPVQTTNYSTTVDSTTTVQTTNFSTTFDSTTPVQTKNFTTTVNSTTPVQTTNFRTTVNSTMPVQTTKFSITVDSTPPVQTTNFSTTVNSTMPVQTTNFTTTVDFTTPVQTTNISNTVNSTTLVQTTNFTTTVDSTTTVQTTNLSTIFNSSTSMQATNFSTTVNFTTPIKTTNFSTIIDSTTPVQTSNLSSTVNSTTTVQTTNFSTTVEFTIPVQTTDFSTTVHSTNFSTTVNSTVPVQTTNISTTVDSTTVQDRKFSAIVNSTIPVQTTSFSIPVNSTTPVKTTNFSTTVNSTVLVQTTDFSTADFTTPGQVINITTIVNTTTQVQTTNFSTNVNFTTPVLTTNLSTNGYTTISVPSTNFSTTVNSITPVQATNFSINVNSTTLVQATNFSINVNSTTPVQTTNFSTNGYSTTPVQTSNSSATVYYITPVQTTDNYTTIFSTTSVQTTDINTTVDSTTPAQTNDIKTTVVSTTSVQTTDINTTVYSTTLDQTTDINTTIVFMTPVQTTDINTTADLTTLVQTKNFSIIVDTSVETTLETPTITNMSINTTYITGAITPTIDTQQTSIFPITTVTMEPTNSTQYSSGIYDSTTMQEITSTITILPSITTATVASTTPSIKWEQVDVIISIPQSWSSNLLNQTSEEYTTLEKDITTNVNTSLNGTASNVTINEVRPGSIIADISVYTSKSEGLEILKGAIKKGEVGKLRVSKSFPVQITGTVNVIVEPKNYAATEGRELSLQCKANLEKQISNDMNNIKIMWMLNGQPIIDNNNADSRVQVTYTQNSTTKAPIGKLTFKKLRLRDTGNIQCLAAGPIKSKRAFIALRVYPLPKVKITSNSPYIEVGQNVTITCSIVNNVTANITFHKAKGSFRSNTTKYFNGKATITLSGVTVESDILCRATNSQGKGEANFIVSVYQPKKVTCPQEGNWPLTPAEQWSEIPCDDGFIGYKMRYCNGDGTWELPSNEFCARVEFGELKERMKDIEDNIGDDTTFVLKELANITDKKKKDNVTVKELLDSIDILDSVVKVTENKNKTKTKESEIDGFFSVANNIIDPSEKKWTAIKEKNETAGVELLKKMEDFGSIIANNIDENIPEPILKTNLVAVVSKVSIEKTNSFPGKVENLDQWVKESKTTMDLTSNLLSELAVGKEDSLAISVILFRNISNLLPDLNNQKAANETTKLTPKLNTMVLSVTVGNNKIVQLENPIQLSFKHLKKVENVESFCSYWDFDNKDSKAGGWSQKGCEVASANSSTTQCNCYHLTNFAVLTTLAPQDSKALRVITYVGCSISIFCCLLTIILYAIFWDNLTKSELGKSKAVLMINMCVAVILSYTLFMAGIKTATVNKDACTTVAAFLHFFCLSLFFSLLIYAVDMAVTIFSVFPTDFNRLPLMLTTSWLLPAIIVAITLGVTNTEGYGNDDFCWLSVDKGVIWAFIGPIIFVIVVNMIILAYLFRTSISSTTIKNKSVRGKIKSGAKSLLLITPIFGITWIVGVFAVNEDTIIFQYVFAIINSLQGLFIFLVFCAFNKQFRQAIASKYHRLVDLRSTDRTILNKSKRTQSSQLREQSSNYDNVVFDASEEPDTDYRNVEPTNMDDGSQNVSFEFEAVPIQDQTRERQYLSNAMDGSNIMVVDRPFSQAIPIFKGPVMYAGNRSSTDALYNPYYQRQYKM